MTRSRFIEAAGEVALALPTTRVDWLEAAAVPTEGAVKQFRMVPAYSGGVLDLPDWDVPVVINLRGLDCASQDRPILMRHGKAENQVVGHSEEIVNDGRTVTVRGVIHAESEAGQAVLKRAKVNYPWQASVGVVISKSRRVPAGETIEANGQAFTGPLELVEAARLREVSFCVIGADGDTHIEIEAEGREANGGGRSSATSTKQRLLSASAEGSANMTFEQWLASLGMDVNTLSEAQVSELRLAFDAKQKAGTAEANAEGDTSGKPQDGQEKPKEGLAAGGAGSRTLEASGDHSEIVQRRTRFADEIERVAAIGTICRGNRTIEAQAVREGWTLDQTRLRMLEANAPTWATSRGNGDGSWDNRAQVLEAAICRLAGVRDATLERQFQPRVLEAADRSDVRGITLGQLFGEFTNAHGGHVRPGKLNRDDLIHVQQINHRVVEAAGGFSSVSLPGILGNAANKILLDAYNAVVSVVPDITAPVSTSDFKEFKAYRLTGKGQLAEVGPDGELKNVSLQEEEYANRVKIHGGILTLTEVMMTNDDLGAFASAASVLGHMAMDDLQLAVIKLKLANTGNFYQAESGNLLTGAPSALGISGLDAAVKAFLEQKDANNRGIMMPPKQLLVPAALKGLGDRIYVAQTLNETTTADRKSANANNHVGLYKVIPIPYAGTNFNAINGNAGSDTRWWLEAAPMPGAAPIYVAYLNGQKAPRIEQGQAPFNVLGTQMRVVFPWGVGFGDKRTSVQNNGV